MHFVFAILLLLNLQFTQELIVALCLRTDHLFGNSLVISCVSGVLNLLIFVVHTVFIHELIEVIIRELLLVPWLDLLMDDLAFTVQPMVFISINRLFVQRTVDHVVLVFASL